MRLFLVLTVVGLGAVGCGGTQKTKNTEKLTPRQIVDRSKAAIVRVEVGNERVGTGFVVDRDGAIATNLHVVVGSSDIKVRTLDGTVLTVPRVLALDPEHDLALIDVDPRRPLPMLSLGDSDKVSAGDPVIVIGNPLGVLDYTVSDGLISSVRPVSEDLTLLQISAPISQGSSGGPLFNSFGEVIGVATAIFNEGQNLNFGVPSNYVRAMTKARKPMTVTEFAELTKAPPQTIDAGGKTIVRKVPHHELSIFDGCKDEQVDEAVKAIGQAIELGAPLYNAGNHEACYRIYEGMSIRFERESECKGVREAFGAGLLRSSTLDSYTEKAWAMRDTFDGLLDVAMRHAEKSGKKPPTVPPPPSKH